MLYSICMRFIVSNNTRAGRLSFLFPALFFVVLPYAHYFVFLKITFPGHNLFGPLSIFFQMVIFLPIFLIPFCIKRLHDFQWSGWFSLVFLIPPLLLPLMILWNESLILVVLLLHVLFVPFLLLMPGTKGENRYGKPPLFRKWWCIIFSILFVAFFVADVYVHISNPSILPKRFMPDATPSGIRVQPIPAQLPDSP